MRLEIVWLLIGMAVVTFLPRFLPIAFLTRWSPPDKIKGVLHYIPVAIMASIVFPILFSSEEGNIGFEPRLLLSSLPVFLFAYRTKNMWASVLLGMLVYWLAGFVFK